MLVRLVQRFAASDFKDGVFVRAHLSHDTAEAIHEWTKTLTLPEGASLVDPNEYHATLIYSKTPFDYSHDTHDSIYPTADATNKHLEVLGKPDNAKALTLRFDSHDLTLRHNSLKDQGGVSDFPTYKPHITIAEDVPNDHDASQHEVFNGPIVFTSESAEPIDIAKAVDLLDALSEHEIAALETIRALGLTPEETAALFRSYEDSLTSDDEIAASSGAPHDLDQHGRAIGSEGLEQRFDPSEPRDPEGKWTDGGGEGEREHPGEGYSKHAWVDKDGVIHTSNVYDAQRALFENKKVELKQPKQVSTLIQRLGETAAEMAEHGEAAPVFNLCNVSVEGTNLFCAETKNIPRVEMPVIPAKQTKAFIKYLKGEGFKVEKDTERAAHLRATQSEISGAKVAASMKRIEKEGFYKRLVVSRDDYILDGHHTWAGQLGVDFKNNNLKGDKVVKVARVDISITKLIAEADKWTKEQGIAKKPASEAAKGVLENGENDVIFWPPEPRNDYGHRDDSFDRDAARAGEVVERFEAGRSQADRGHHGASSAVDGSGSNRTHRGDGRPQSDGRGGAQTGGQPQRLAFDPSQPRDEHGRWTETGGDSAGEHVEAVHQSEAQATFHRLNASGNGRFHDAITTAKNANPFGASVHAYPADEYRGMRMFLTPDGKSGFALKGDDIVSAFKHPSSSQKDFANAALSLATQQGGRRLDAFDTVLPDIYSKNGFRAVARLAWDDAQKPEGWNYKTFGKYNGGRPDVVFMVHDLVHAQSYKPGDGKRVASYDEGVAAQTAALAALEKRDWDEAQHPREPAGSPEGGQFAGGGGGGEGATAPAATEPKLDPKVVEVGGDEWNKATAKRLEREYQKARPLLDSLTRDAVKLSAAMGNVPVPASEEIEDEPYYPESWDELSNTKQQEIEDAYVEHETPNVLTSEVDNWYSSGGALDDAKNLVAWRFTKGHDLQWAVDGIKEVQEERKEAGKSPLPFEFPNEYLDNMTVEYSGNGEGQEDPDIEFDDKGLDEEHVVGIDPAQQALLGIPEPKPSERLTEEMRDEIVSKLTELFNKKAEDLSGSMDAPEYLEDTAKEYAEQFFGEMSDKQKFEWAYEHDQVDKPESETKDSPPENKIVVEALPEKFDPLNETSGASYKRTQQLARFLSVARANEIIVERGLRKTSVDPARMAAIDHSLWDAWKGSSTSDNGKLLQVATADELGGRLNTKAGKQIDVDYVKEFANHRYADIGGYAGVKAYVRAKWETTQYLLDRAGEQELELYRGINLKRHDPARFEQAVKEKGVKKQIVATEHQGYKSSYEKLPTVKVDRNGAASATTDPSIANGWGVQGESIVLRALVPRTAAISIPAYGINIHSEHEVVIAGTAYKSWDAWLDKAPAFSALPIGANGSGIGTNAPKLAA